MKQISQDFFHDPKEEFKSILGEGYITSILARKGLRKSSMVLSNRRLYQTGKIYELNRSGKGFTKTSGKKVVPLADITGTAFRKTLNPLWIGLGSFFFIIGLIPLVTGEHMEVFTAFMVSIGVIFLVIYALNKEQFFVVEYSGGSVGVPCKWYSNNEIENFQKSISIEKDKLQKYN